jgi:hypothetical protein
MNPEMKIMREVSDQAENFYDDAVGLGDHAANALEARHRSQMTELENIADSALKSSDIFDYIKKQSARFPYWRKGFAEHSDPKIGFGERLKTYLEKDMALKLKTICDPNHLNIGDSSDGDKKKRRRIYLMLIRQFIHQMVAEYEYQTSPAPPAKKKEA